MNLKPFAAGDLVDSITLKIGDLTLNQAHNVIDPCYTESVVRKPAIPLCTSIPGGQLEEGTQIALTGTADWSLGKRFNIDFIVDKCEHPHRDLKQIDHVIPNSALETTKPHGSDEHKPGVSGMTPMEDLKVAFHFNARFGTNPEDNMVVLNSKLREWGTEERYKAQQFPFTIGKQFKLTIRVENEGFRVAVDKKECFLFKYRCDYNNIGRIHVEGNLTVDFLDFHKELQELTQSSSSSSTSSNSSSDSEHGPSAASSAVKSRTINSPTLPYLEQDVRLGKTFNVYIAGHLPTNFSGYFIINLITMKAPIRTIPFHLSIRPAEQVILHNTMTDGRWLRRPKEVIIQGPFPFILGTDFDLMICHRPDAGSHFSVSCNGHLMFAFKNRVSSVWVDALEITGNQQITSVRYEFF